VGSSPVIPFNDPTILFTNAGMNQFKDVFTGQRKVDYKRATSSQKCIRAGGKHNDLDNVGFTARHLTFFEMLGNFSFGDYFKEEAIFYAWEWVTKHLKLPTEQLYATVYETDDDAFALWEKIAPELKNGRILRFGKKDNFWSMGDVGPCGPCSEIHIDRGAKFGTGPEDKVNGETDRFMELGNLVFMQFDQQPGGKLVPLPKPSVDTGSGLERIAFIMQGADNVYGTDIFQVIIHAISELTHASYEKHTASHNVIADHVRSLTFALADGAGISNEGRGYVLRRILRRAARHGRLLGAHEPFIYKLVPVVVDQMGEAYPDIREKQEHVQRVIRAEEEGFLRTLETGLDLFEKVAQKVKASSSTVVDGETVFKLYDTYGFPADLTEIIAHEHGLAVDLVGFEDAMSRQQAQSRKGSEFRITGAQLGKTLTTLAEEEKWSFHETKFIRGHMSIGAVVQYVKQVDGAVAVILDKTPFYVEAGGQVTDTGRMIGDGFEIAVSDVVHVGHYYVHIGQFLTGSIELIRPGLHVGVELDSARRWDIMRNHTATHLLHAALRQVLGEHVKQGGSYVGPDRLRFDFSHHQPMTADDIRRVEEIVNAQILEASDVQTDIMPIEEAKKTGAMALFGEKYGDTVRVVSVPGFSKELCGGTHVTNVAQIGPFMVTLETGIASGVRRIEAVTGRIAAQVMLDDKAIRLQAAQLLGRREEEIIPAIEQLKESVVSLQKELKKVKSEMFSGGGKSLGQQSKVGPVTLVTHNFGDTDKDIMTAWLDTEKAKPGAIVVAALGQTNGKPTYIAAANTSAVSDHRIDVGAISKELLAQFGGRGGGKASFAQGGVAPDTDPDALFSKMKSLLEAQV
jgi:alanyl-tRNA synthetase